LELKIKYKNAANRYLEAIKNLAVTKENKPCDDVNLGSFYKYLKL